MKPRQFILPLAREIVVDLFAGGGGASTGIEQAIGRHVDIAVNHDPEAVSLHEANHPQTRHFVSDVFEVDPRVVADGRPIGLLWASPDCKHFSKAKGGKPVSKKIRSLAWVVVKWARLVRPRVICLENVEEFQTWGPLADDGQPCPQRKGLTFRRWVRELQREGYAVEWRELRACDYGAPTIRKRLFLVARCDGQPIVWPQPTHGPGRKPYRTAAECIDWSLPCPSIFERERPLAEATLRRIAHGIKRYVLDAAKPFIVPVTHQGDARVHSTADPLRTITTAQRGEFALCSSTVVKHNFGDNPAHAIDGPLHTVTTQSNKHALVAAFLAKHYGGNETPGWPCDKSISTITTRDHHHLVTSHLAKLRGTSNSAGTDEPIGTISAQGQHHAEVRALLVKYYGTDQDPKLGEPLHTVTTKDRFGLVTVKGVDYFIADIGMRMLQPRELYRAQGFPDDYEIECGADGRRLSKAAQVRMCGNSVCPPVAAALVRANFATALVVERTAA
jgi:DNA (cytosine-5)-methyltransferase 1